LSYFVEAAAAATQLKKINLKFYIYVAHINGNAKIINIIIKTGFSLFYFIL
jgi:hypothetical protein